MYKTAKYQNKVNNQTVQIFDSWKSAHSNRHFLVISRIENKEYTTISKQHAYPNYEAAMEAAIRVEQWLTNHQI